VTRSPLDPRVVFVARTPGTGYATCAPVVAPEVTTGVLTPRGKLEQVLRERGPARS
jgi:hypothetical protein